MTRLSGYVLEPIRQEGDCVLYGARRDEADQSRILVFQKGDVVGATCHDRSRRPRGHGLVTSLARPDGNITGVTSISPEMQRGWRRSPPCVVPALTAMPPAAVCSLWASFSCRQVRRRSNT
jgi:hypothetical protein